jgi:hypothetical protein
MNPKKPAMRAAAAAALSVGLGCAGLGLAGTAQASPPYGPFTWCPGQQKSAYMPPNMAPGPASPGDGGTDWDWNVCHTFWIVNWGDGNTPGADRSVFEGPEPPPPSPAPPGVINATNCEQILGIFCPHA